MAIRFRGMSSNHKQRSIKTSGNYYSSQIGHSDIFERLKNVAPTKAPKLGRHKREVKTKYFTLSCSTVVLRGRPPTSILNSPRSTDGCLSWDFEVDLAESRDGDRRESRRDRDLTTNQITARSAQKLVAYSPPAPALFTLHSFSHQHTRKHYWSDAK